MSATKGQFYARLPVFDPVRESTPTYTLERQVRQARLDMGEARWAKHMAEWDEGQTK